MSTNIKFQAYIPKSLGKPLYDYFKDDYRFKMLRNKNEFEKKLKSLDINGYNWIPEPGNSLTDYYCSTDNIDYPPIRSLGHSIRLGFELELDINKIGQYYPMYSSDILKHNASCNGNDKNQHSGFSHRVQVFFEEVGGLFVGHIKAFEPLKSPEKPLICTVRSVRPWHSKDFDTTEINVIASAGYPYTNRYFTPTIDFNIFFSIQRTDSRGIIHCSGWHNDFPAYELIVDNTRIYRYIPKDKGPGIFNLGIATTHLNCSKIVFL
ncbi:hypothetical protein ACIRNY_02770 [Capnocytophaga canimorsus]|uniref:hypothetical protein n=1 Tax=Capnocytophaga canimorsus TaxID=28188 RepID=UPI0038516542